MTPIFKPDGEVYCWVSTDSGLLRIKFNNGSAHGHTVNLDEKIIPDLIQILTLLQQAGVEK
jgi:hypothetical protein